MSCEDMLQYCRNPNRRESLVAILNLIYKNLPDSTAAFNKLIEMSRKRDISRQIFQHIKKIHVTNEKVE
jgi:hypothetical protein